MEQYPPNSQTAKAKAKKPKQIEQVSSVTATRKKKTLGSKFKDTFVQGDAKSAAANAANAVVVPMIRDMLYEFAQSTIQNIIFGQAKQHRSQAPPSGLFGRVAYDSVTNPTRASQAATSRPAKARHSFDELVLDNRQGAEEVINRMMDILSQWEVVSVADLYALVGFETSTTDFKWGWTDLRGAGVDRTRNGGYVLNLPKPKPID